MKCYCCEREVSLTHHVKLRGDVSKGPSEVNSPDDASFISYQENSTYRSAFVCPACYGTLDSADGTGEIAGRSYAIAGQSRGRKAAVYNQAKYDVFQRKLASQLGIDAE